MIGCRDPLGIRPLVIGKLNDAYILPSETVALDVVGAEFVRSVDPGELVIVRDGELVSHRPSAERAARPCIFAYVYFYHPDSLTAGTSLSRSEERWGGKSCVGPVRSRRAPDQY